MAEYRTSMWRQVYDLRESPIAATVYEAHVGGGVYHRVAVLWDEDRDTRILPVLDALLCGGYPQDKDEDGAWRVLPVDVRSVLAIGESKGGIVTFVRTEEDGLELLRELAHDCVGPDGDWWSGGGVEVVEVLGETRSLHPYGYDEAARVMLLWAGGMLQERRKRVGPYLGHHGWVVR